MRTGYFKVGMTGGAVALAQAVAAPVICVTALFAAAQLYGVPFSSSYVALAIISALLCYILIRPSTDWQGFASGWSIARNIAFAWLAIVGILLLLGYATKVSAVYSRRLLFVWFLATPLLTIGVTIVLRGWFRHILVSSGKARSAVIAGVNDASRRLATSLVERHEIGIDFRGYFDDRASDRLGKIEPGALLGRLEDVPAFVKSRRIDIIFIALPISHIQRTKELLEHLRDTTASIYFVPDIFVYDLIQSRTDELNGIPIVALCETPLHGWPALVKRSSDIVLGSLMLAAALPVMLLIAVGIKLTSPGSIIFRQRRYGLDGEEIVVYKFRTMTVSEDGDKVEQARRNDDRITPLGRILRRYSLDELPQLINVLQGRMSVVGPRPHAVVHNEIYRKLIPGYMVRHKVTPGITGLAQVSGCRGETTSVEEMEKRIEYDLEYVRHWSLLLDLKILFRTLAIWWNDDKAY
jgi:putative colanic acid biosynthesis UDP-glucose lipid carrier transferase